MILGIKRSFGDLDDDEDDIFGSKKVILFISLIYICLVSHTWKPIMGVQLNFRGMLLLGHHEFFNIVKYTSFLNTAKDLNSSRVFNFLTDL